MNETSPLAQHILQCIGADSHMLDDGDVKMINMKRASLADCEIALCIVY